MNTQARDAELREQIAGSCRVIMRHIEGIAEDAKKISELPSYKTEAEDSLNLAGRVVALAAQAISAAKVEMGKKQLERT